MESDSRNIYHALLRPHNALGDRAPIEAVTPENVRIAARAVVKQCSHPGEPLVGGPIE